MADEARPSPFVRTLPVPTEGGPSPFARPPGPRPAGAVVARPAPAMFSPMDLLFYALAIWQGYKFSIVSDKLST